MLSYANKMKGIAMEEPDLAIFTLEELQGIINAFKTNLPAIQEER